MIYSLRNAVGRVLTVITFLVFILGVGVCNGTHGECSAGESAFIMITTSFANQEDESKSSREVKLSPFQLAKWYTYFDRDMNNRLDPIENLGWERFTTSLMDYVNSTGQLDQFDENGDGRLGGREKTRFVDKVAQDLELFDVNRNGVLDLHEQRTLTEFFLNPSAQPDLPGPTGHGGSPYDWVNEPESDYPLGAPVPLPMLPPFNVAWSQAKQQAWHSWSEAQVDYYLEQMEYDSRKANGEVYDGAPHNLLGVFEIDPLEPPAAPDPVALEIAKQRCEMARQRFESIDG